MKIKLMQAIVPLIMLVTSSSVAYAEQLQPTTRTMKHYQEVFELDKESIFSIYLNELKNSPGIGGRVNFQIRILANGSVANCLAKPENESLKPVGDKVCKHIKKMNFGDGDELDLPYVINFFPF